MSWSGRRVLVTGAGGFIGSHLAERLVELGARTRALVHYDALGSWGWLDASPRRDELEVVAGDITDPECLREVFQGVEVVFHLAALIAIPYSYRAPRSYLRTNVEGTLNVLEAARAASARVVHTSTSEVYGTAQSVPIAETHPLVGQSPYAASKIGADQLACAYHCSYGLPVATVRPFNTYGPRQSARAVVPTIIVQALTRPEVRLGNTAPTRDLVFVEDTVAGFLAVAASDACLGRVVNLGTGREVSVGDLAAKIVALVGREVPVVVDPARVRPGASEVERLCADARLVRELTGWEPRRSLEDGLATTVDWLREHAARYRADRYVT